MSPDLTRRYPTTQREVTERDHEVPPAIGVLQFLKGHWPMTEQPVRFGARDKWWDGTAGNQIYIKPVRLGISKKNIMTLGANYHRRDPIYAVHIFSRSADEVDKMTDLVDDIVKDNGVNPQRGIQFILPAEIPSVPADEPQDDGSMLYHNVYFVEVRFYKYKA